MLATGFPGKLSGSSHQSSAFVRSNHLGPEGAEALAPMLAALTDLASLSLLYEVMLHFVLSDSS